MSPLEWGSSELTMSQLCGDGNKPIVGSYSDVHWLRTKRSVIELLPAGRISHGFEAESVRVFGMVLWL